MEKREIIQKLKQLHDAMVFGTSIIPSGVLIRAVFEAADLIEAMDEIEIVLEV